VAEVTKEIFIEEYQNFTGSDREFAEYLNKKYKPKPPFNAKSVFSRRKRAGIETINPKATGDYKGLEKYIKNFKGKFRPGLFDIANRFGFKDKGVVEKMINRVNPDMKKATPPGRLPPGAESVEAKQKREREERKAELKKKEKTRITEKKFKEEYKKFKPVKTGSDVEFAEYLNKNTKYTAYRGEPFSGRNVNQFRRDFGLESKLFTTRPKALTDKDILEEVDRMSLDIDVKKLPMDKIRTAVFGARALEKNMTDAQKRELYIARNKRKNTRNQPRFFTRIPVEKTPKGLFWQDLVENALRHQTFLKKRRGTPLPESHIKFLNPEEPRSTSLQGGKDIKLIDTNVIDPKTGKPKVLTYDNFLKHADDNAKIYGMNSKQILQEYEKKRFIQTDPELRDALNKKISSRYDPNNVFNRQAFSPFHIHHTAGRGTNAFNVQLGISTENMKENAIRTRFQKEFVNANTLSGKKAAFKKYITDTPDNLEIRPKNVPYGTRESFENLITRVTDADTTFDFAKKPRDKLQLTDEQLKGIKAFAQKPGGNKILTRLATRGGVPAVLAFLGLSAFGGGSAEAAEVKQPAVTEPLKYDATQGSIVNANTDQKADQNQILEYVKDNPLKVTAGTSLGFAAQEVPGAYKAARDLGRGRVRSTLGISGAIRPVLTTFGTPLITGLYEGAIGAKRLDEGETMTDILTDPVGPALGLTLMEPLSKLSGVVRDAPKRTMLEGAKNYFNLSNVGQARPGLTGQILRMGLSPRMIAGASRFLGLPGIALGAGLAGYDAYKNYQNQEGMIYNLFNRDE
jgi:hypothetical protein